MKLNPPLLALLAGGVAAIVLLRPRPTAAQQPQRGFLDRAQTLGTEFLADIDYMHRYGYPAATDAKIPDADTLTWFDEGLRGTESGRLGFWDLIAPPSWSRNVTTFGQPY